MKLVLASGNAGKLHEIQEYLSGNPFTIIPQAQFNINEIAEDQPTFVENAILKARHACRLAGLPAIADDSGLEVDSLQGAPGILSARYAGIPSNAKNNIAKLLVELKNIPEGQRTARFQCVMVLLKYPSDPTPLICQGSWAGRILFAPRGEQGFGYDPIFYVPTHDCAAAELPLATKNQISHRAQALKQLREFLLRAAGLARVLRT